jgi:hypothetical protein
VYRRWGRTQVCISKRACMVAARQSEICISEDGGEVK